MKTAVTGVEDSLLVSDEPSLSILPGLAPSSRRQVLAVLTSTCAAVALSSMRKVQTFFASTLFTGLLIAPGATHATTHSTWSGYACLKTYLGGVDTYIWDCPLMASDDPARDLHRASTGFFDVQWHGTTLGTKNVGIAACRVNYLRTVSSCATASVTSLSPNGNAPAGNSFDVQLPVSGFTAAGGSPFDYFYVEFQGNDGWDPTGVEVSFPP